jgi:hypothetical protein
MAIKPHQRWENALLTMRTALAILLIAAIACDAQEPLPPPVPTARLKPHAFLSPKAKAQADSVPVHMAVSVVNAPPRVLTYSWTVASPSPYGDTGLRSSTAIQGAPWQTICRQPESGTNYFFEETNPAAPARFVRAYVCWRNDPSY